MASEREAVRAVIARWAAATEVWEYRIAKEFVASRYNSQGKRSPVIEAAERIGWSVNNDDYETFVDALEGLLEDWPSLILSYPPEWDE